MSVEQRTGELRRTLREGQALLNVRCDGRRKSRQHTHASLALQDLDVNVEGLLRLNPQALHTHTQLFKDGLEAADAVAALADHALAEGPAAASCNGDDQPPDWLLPWCMQLTSGCSLTSALLQYWMAHCCGTRGGDVGKRQRQQARLLKAAVLPVQAAAALAAMACRPGLPGEGDLLNMLGLCVLHCLRGVQHAFAALGKCSPLVATAALASYLSAPAVHAALASLLHGLATWMRLRENCSEQLCKAVFNVLRQLPDPLLRPHAQLLVADGGAVASLAQFVRLCHAASLRDDLWRTERYWHEFHHQLIQLLLALASLPWPDTLTLEALPVVQAAVAIMRDEATLVLRLADAEPPALLPAAEPPGTSVQRHNQRPQQQQQQQQQQARLQALYQASLLGSIQAVSCLFIFAAQWREATWCGPTRWLTLWSSMVATLPAAASFFSRQCEVQLSGGEAQRVHGVLHQWTVCLENVGAFNPFLAQEFSASPGHRATLVQQVPACLAAAEALVRLAARLPQLAHVLNGGQPRSGPGGREAAQPAECSCRACGGRGGYASYDASALVQAAQQLLSALVDFMDLSMTWAELKPFTRQLALLHVTVCKAPHAVLALTQRDLELAGLAVQPPDRLSNGRLPAADAADLCYLVQHSTTMLLRALAASKAAAGGGAGREQAAAKPSKWDRRVACCLLEATAALAAVRPYTGGSVLRTMEGAQAARQWTVEAVQSLRISFEERYVHPPARPNGNQVAQLLWLTSPLLPDELAAQLALLMHRMLPPGVPGPAPADERLASAAAAAEVPLEAAQLQTWVLAKRHCGYLRCPDMAGCSENSVPPGKKCARCLQVRYCSTACQRADWKAHKQACAAPAGNWWTHALLRAF